MSEFKTVPMEPTPEMVEAAEEAYMPFGDMDLAIRMAVLTAPAVQGEHDKSRRDQEAPVYEYGVFDMNDVLVQTYTPQSEER